VIDPRIMLVGQQAKQITISGQSLYDATDIEIKSGDASLIVKTKTATGGNKLQVTLDLSKAKPGNYDLIIKNGEQKKLLLKNQFFIRDDTFFNRVDSGDNRLTVNLGVGSIYFVNTDASGAFLPGYGVNVQLQFDMFRFWQITPSVGGSYFRIKSKENTNLEVDLINLELALGYLFRLRPNLGLRLVLGAGGSIAKITETDKPKKPIIGFQVMNLMVATEVHYFLTENYSLHLGSSFLNIFDSGGTTLFAAIYAGAGFHF